MNETRARWLALWVLCLGDLMIVLDTNIVNVALPSIQSDLGFSQTALAWVVNAYMLTFGGFLLLSGRLGDLYGNRRVFLGGVVAFTLSSIACGLAPNSAFLVVGRAVQGLGGAAVSAVALALIMGLFTDPAERAKAMGVFGFVMSGGGAVGVLLGGVLTGLFSWHWIFLVNVPIGVAVLVLAGRVLPADGSLADREPLDVPGAGLVTLALMVAVYGVVGGNEAGWTSTRTLALLGTAAVLLVAFVVRQATADAPAGAPAALPVAQRRGEPGRRRAVGRRDVRLLLPVGSLPPAGAGLRRAGRRPGVPPLLPGDGRLLARSERQDRDVVRHPGAADGRPRPGRRQPGALQPGAGRRHLPRRRAARDGAAGHRRRDRVQPGAAGRDGRRRAARGRPGLGRGQHQLHDGRRTRPGRARRGLLGPHVVDRGRSAPTRWSL